MHKNEGKNQGYFQILTEGQERATIYYLNENICVTFVIQVYNNP